MVNKVIHLVFIDFYGTNISNTDLDFFSDISGNEITNMNAGWRNDLM